jgi:hypothetical protein
MNFDELYKLQEDIRRKRRERCFPIVNRGTLWYRRLTNLQLGELNEWYQKWLDATKTLIVPDDLPWVNGTLADEEEL